MRACPKCKQILTSVSTSHCQHCGHELEATPVQVGNVSAAERSLDQMVEDASVPSLATLFRAGKQAGYIKPIQGYTAGV